ncbi:B3 domain-containing protein At5g60140-like [Patiria miniata]|uniref:Kazal-like domain-containing protein n=1 Tax=Patiria miniata TaxID=46514 RepID=A0A914BSF5_PATMI|nr:B3 domain-containing protein At5g60140-like [Patiria miniata]
MEDQMPCLRAARHLVMVWAVLLFVITTLRAAEEADITSIFPKCKEEVETTDIEGLIDTNPCMFQCPPTVKMVCSNDGMSHMNDCFLCKSACNDPSRPIFKVCDGRCPCKGKPHDEDMEASEDCVDGACKTDAKDHYAEDYGYDVENPEAKYTSPVYTEGTTDDVLHESKGYAADPDGADEEEEEEDEEEEGEDGDDDLEDGQEVDLEDGQEMELEDGQEVVLEDGEIVVDE